ncbi:vanin-like protein 2 [Drosophila innubila]|uniref:vanin-like protein 2 n=1 Tax=Drosophila innubila TaxID=198719 RepID=UPI00148E71E6|nr:vanin-like protein 2 [Drosophila innubila]
MNLKVFRLLLLATLLVSTKQLSLRTDSSYNAGVVEFKLIESGNPSDRVSQATMEYMKIIESNATADLDILVFPEYVLNNREMATFVPHPSQNVTPCFEPDYELFLVELSCAVRARGIYVVLNVFEKELCGKDYGSKTWNPCPADGVRYFNTNVVLDRRGQVVSRYRKTHLWRGEYKKNAVLREPDMATFETDFGVTFGHFICFDMLFYEPAMRLILERNITDIIYPTYWFSELPFLSAVQLQEGWSYANDVNLLAADGSKPAGRTTGSGIYAGRNGRLTAAIFEVPTTRLLTARVPKKSRYSGKPFELATKVVPIFSAQLVTKRYTEVATFRDYNVDIFQTQLLEADFLNATQKLCHNDFCCDFQVLRRPIGSSVDYAAYRYRLAVYRGNETTFIRVDRSEQAICAIFACTTEHLLSCGRIFPAAQNVANKLYFEKIHISGVFPAAPRRLIMPSTLDGVFLPLDVAQYKFEESPPAKELKHTRIDMQLIQPKNDLLTFGIWANYFTELPTSHNLDHLQPTLGGGSTGSAGTPAPSTTDNAAPALTSASIACFLLVAFALKV